MKANMGTIDRVIRIVVAIIFFYLYYAGIVSGVLGFILLALGVIFVLTGAVAFCPLYLPFKFSTKK